MKCLRCGTEIDESQVFCSVCLEDMERHPVKPGTPIYLPKKDRRNVAKRGNFRLAESKWKDRIFRLKYTIFWLLVLIFVLIAALVLCITMMLDVAPEWVYRLFASDHVLQTFVNNSVP